MRGLYAVQQKHPLDNMPESQKLNKSPLNETDETIQTSRRVQMDDKCVSA